MGVHGPAVGYCSESTPDMTMCYRTFRVTRLSWVNLLLRVFCSLIGYEKWSESFRVSRTTPVRHGGVPDKLS